MTAVIFDIDGVITDGTVVVDADGNQSKRVNLKDVDAIYELHRRGIYIGAVTAEKNNFSAWVRGRFPWNVFYEGLSEKGHALKEIRRNGCGYIVYIGDGRKDISAFHYADFKICPQDAIAEIKALADYILEGNAGTGSLWELIALEDAGFECSQSKSDSGWCETLEEHYRLVRKIIKDREYQRAAEASARLICEALLNNRRVVIFGNGGSAADAQHIAAEFLGRFHKERRSLDMEALTVNTSLLTAVGNDYSFDDVFFRQIEGMTHEGDVAIGISTSGTSANVRKALDGAKYKHVKTILLTGNRVNDMDYDVTLKVCSDNTARIQEIHILTGHFWADYMEKRLCEANNDDREERGHLITGEKQF